MTEPTKDDREAAIALDEHNEILARAVQEKFKLPLVTWPGIRDMIDAHMIPERELARRENVVRRALANEVRKHQSNHPAVFISDAFDRAAAEALNKEKVT